MALDNKQMIVVDGNLYFNRAMEGNLHSDSEAQSVSHDHPSASSVVVTNTLSSTASNSTNNTPSITASPSQSLESNINTVNLEENSSSKKVIILKKGTMRKQNRVSKQWKKRWFVLRSDGHLLCYNNKEFKHLLDTIDCKNLVEITCESWGQSEKRMNGIHIETSRRSWHLLCRTNDVRIGWISKFEKVSGCDLSL